MLGLAALERSQLHCLESSICTGVYPVLRVHLVNELESGQERRSSLGQDILGSDEQESDLALQSSSKETKITSSLEGIAEPEDQLSKDYPVGVMLGSVERGGSLELASSSQSLLLQESAGSSALHVAANILDVSLHPDLLARKDDVSDTVLQMSAKTAGMVAMGAGAVLHSEQNDRICILRPDTQKNECPDLKSLSSDIFSEMPNIITKDPQVSLRNSTKEHVYKKSSVSALYTGESFPVESTNDSDAASETLCLEDTQSPLQLCTFVTLNKNGTNPTYPSIESVESEINSTTEKSITWGTTSFASESLSGCATNGEADHENVLDNAVYLDTSVRSVMSDCQEMENVNSAISQNNEDSEATHPSPLGTENSDVSMEPINKQDSLRSPDALTGPTILEENVCATNPALEVALSGNSNSALLEDASSAKSACLDSLSTIKRHINNLKDSECQKHCSFVRDHECLAQHADMNCSPSMPSTVFSVDGEHDHSQEKGKRPAPVFPESCESLDQNPKDLEMEELHHAPVLASKGNGEELPVTAVVHPAQWSEETSQDLKEVGKQAGCCLAQPQTLSDSTCDFSSAPIIPLTLMEDAHSLESNTMDSRRLAAEGCCHESGEFTELRQQIIPRVKNLKDISEDVCNRLFSETQEHFSLALKKAHLKSDLLKDVPYQAMDSRTSSLANCTEEAATQSALVPYIDILGSLAVPKSSFAQSETSEPLLFSITPSCQNLDTCELHAVTEGVTILTPSFLTGNISEQGMEMESSEDHGQNKIGLKEGLKDNSINMARMLDLHKDSVCVKASSMTPHGIVNSLIEDSTCMLECEEKTVHRQDVSVNAEVSHQHAFSPAKIDDASSDVQSTNFAPEAKDLIMLPQFCKDSDFHTDILPAGSFSQSLFSSVDRKTKINQSCYRRTINSLRTSIANLGELSIMKELFHIDIRSVDFKPYNGPHSTSDLVYEHHGFVKDCSHEEHPSLKTDVQPDIADGLLVSSIGKPSFGEFEVVAPAEVAHLEIEQKLISDHNQAHEIPFVCKLKKPLRKPLLSANKSQIKIPKQSMNRLSFGRVENSPVKTRLMRKKLAQVSDPKPLIRNLSNVSLQEVKRPLNANSESIVCAQHTAVQHVNMDTIKGIQSLSQNRSLHPHSRSVCRNKGLHAFNVRSYLSKIHPGQRQPSRNCKNISVQDDVQVPRHSDVCSDVTLVKDSAMSVAKKDSSFLQFDTTQKPMAMTCYPPSRNHQVVQGRVVHAQDHTLLQRLSLLASRLMTQFQCPDQGQYSNSGLKRTTYDGVQLQVRKLLEVFSCINMKLSSPAGEVWSETLALKGGSSRFLSQPPDLFAACPSQAHFKTVSTSALNPCDNTNFPASFHFKVNSNHLPDFIRFSPTNRFKPPSSEWTFSVSLSPNFCASSENLHLPQWNQHFRALEAPRSISNERAPSVKRVSGCSMRGLHTILALSSPGCYRLWTRRRNLGSRIPTIQRLSVAQFAQGLKGLQPQVLPARKHVSLPCTLGRVLSTWSQHGPSSFTDINTPHPNCSAWPPGFICNIRPQHPSIGIPKLLLNTGISKFGIQSLAEESPIHAVAPKNCIHLEPLLGLPSFSETPVYQFKQQEVLPTSCIDIKNTSQDDSKEAFERKPQRVSQIRIRKTVPKPDPNLTPMGLPKAKRINKKEFSLEDIYTNKNYKSPPVARSLETIFEEPKEKNGMLISISQQKRKRILEFRDCTVPKLKRARGKTKVISGFKRGRKAAVEEVQQLDALLVQKLMDLENFLLEQEAAERA